MDDNMAYSFKQGELADRTTLGTTLNILCSDVPVYWAEVKCCLFLFFLCLESNNQLMGAYVDVFSLCPATGMNKMGCCLVIPTDRDGLRHFGALKLRRIY